MRRGLIALAPVKDEKKELMEGGGHPTAQKDNEDKRATRTRARFLLTQKNKHPSLIAQQSIYEEVNGS